MKIQNLSITAACLSVALTGVSEVGYAKDKDKSKSHKKEYVSQLSRGSQEHDRDHDDKHHKDHKKKGHKGYPNGRPWKAIEKDLDAIKDQNRSIKKKTKAVLRKLDDLEEDTENMQDDILDIASDVSALYNTLQIEVSVLPTTDDGYGVDRLIAHVFVQVSQNGIGLVELDSSSFSFSKAFAPKGGTAFYCGQSCFTKAENGLYVIDLKGSDVAGNYAGTLIVEDVSNAAVPTGTSLVTFELPEPQLAATPDKTQSVCYRKKKRPLSGPFWLCVMDIFPIFRDTALCRNR